jgi:hypothetical protein
MAATASAGYTLLNDFLAETLQYCSGAPGIMLRIHLINSAIDLCNKSQILKKTPSPLSLGEETHTYTLKYPQNRYRAIAVDEVKFSDSERPLVRTTEREMDGSQSNWRSATSNKPTRYWLTDELNKIRIWPTPKQDIDEDLTVETIVTYRRGQVEVDDFIYEKWHEYIQAGALSKVLAIPSASWFNPDLARGFARSFKHGIREARKTTLTGTGKYPGRVIPQNFIVVGGSNTRSGGSQWE